MKKIVHASRGEIVGLAAELAWLMQALGVEPEMRDGVYSDDSRLADLFSVLDSHDEIRARIAGIGLSVSPRARLVDVLRIDVPRMNTPT